VGVAQSGGCWLGKGQTGEVIDRRFWILRSLWSVGTLISTADLGPTYEFFDRFLQFLEVFLVPFPLEGSGFGMPLRLGSALPVRSHSEQTTVFCLTPPFQHRERPEIFQAEGGSARRCGGKRGALRGREDKVWTNERSLISLGEFGPFTWSMSPITTSSSSSVSATSLVDFS